MQIIIITLSCYNINSQSVAVMLLIKKVFNISSISVIRVITMSCGCHLVGGYTTDVEHIYGRPM